VETALSEFDGAVPHRKMIRDVLTHFDEYERGIGRLQASGKVPKSCLSLFAPTRNTGVVAVGSMELDIDLASRVSDALMRRVLTEVRRHLSDPTAPGDLS
jgi:hypothetical protein